MNISRHGSSADHGTYSIKLPAPRIAFDAKQSTLKLTHDCVPDFATNATHDYYIDISLEELGYMIGQVANGLAEVGGDSIATRLLPYLPELTVLAAACAKKAHLPPKTG